MTQLSRQVLEKREVDDLHAVQWSALRYFQRAGRRASTVMGLSRYLGNTTGSASRTAKSLLDRGLIRGEPARHDGRSVLFSLTKAGQAALQRDPLLDVVAALSVLESDELALLGDLLDKVQVAMTEARNGAV
nr:MarR family transcriptional regulator [Parvularcula dongshanensis]